ncbi:PAS domain-containing sensor histidine kinase [Paenibacillus selenitireducens]|uniref:histidine kinase n=1 Tax=Paenibacillus selenitireducens TaxID=1324314 RepID=A0A1T2X0Y8_9BACL|nr:ATP-binding protein [Paenibacillus selenitireducens]OPA73559.1 PAS domain-containing sensor histidine kinase [Paenibacillus selenitireducens]
MNEFFTPGIDFTRETYNYYVERLPHMFALLVDLNGVIHRCNTAFTKVLGFVQEDVLGQPIHAFCVESYSMEEMMIRYQERLQEDRIFKIHIETKMGDVIQAETTVCSLRVEGTPMYSIMMCHTRNMRELSLLQQFSGTFIRDVNLGVIIMDRQFNLVDISDMACNILGIQSEDVMNKPMHDIFKGMPLEHQLVQRAILDGVIVRNHAMSWMNNQERYELLMDSNVLRDEEGDIVGAYVIFKDVSNLRSLEEQVNRSDRLAMIGQIAAGTAHEIRNPLTSIKGFLQVFRKTLQDKGMDKEQGYTEIMLTELNRINDLVSEFLLLSKPKHVSFDVIDVYTIINEMLPIISNEAILHDVNVVFEDTQSAWPNIVADRELLKQVFLNICKNGIEAMVDGGTLTISVKIDRSQRICIEIRDTGPGIPSFMIDKIFDPFFTTKQEGTGLGLSICQRIIHDIGGVIRVASKGFGTTFTVAIPYHGEVLPRLVEPKTQKGALS